MNTETKHTPGPWIAEIIRTSPIHQFNIRAENGKRHIATCNPALVDEREANAIFIASAPDMARELAQLKADKAELVEFIRYSQRILGGHSGAPGDPVTGIELEQRSSLYDQASALIAKAKGVMPP